MKIQDSVYNLFVDFSLSKNEVQRTDKCAKFNSGLQSALLSDSKGEFKFDSLKKYKVMIESPDKQVQIFTWDLEVEDGTHTYFGFVHSYNKKSKQFEVYELHDKSDVIRDPENATLDNQKWYGAYYYQIGEVKYKKSKQYILLGWDGNTMMTDKRLIEVLFFDSKGTPKFGDAIFGSESGKIKKRIVFEFRADVVMSLKYDSNNKSIMFDHLSPSDPSLEGVFEYYGPDFTYDTLEFKEGKWKYSKNVLLRNGKDRTDKYYQIPK